MPFTIKLEGYDTLGFGPKIDMPDIFELAQMPLFVNANIDDAYKHGNDFQRKLIDQIPYKGGYKHTMVSYIVQYLTPQWSSIENQKWHLDPGVPAAFKYDARLHILCSGYDLTCTTKFLEKGCEIELPDEYWNTRHRTLREYISDHADEWGFKPVAVPTDQFVTFSNLHLHIAPPPLKNELRFFMRSQESNIEEPRPWENAKRDNMKALVSDPDSFVTCFQQLPNGIFIRTKI